MEDEEFSDIVSESDNRFPIYMDGERIESLRSLISYYQRRVSRLIEEKKQVEEMIENQYELIDLLGVNDPDMDFSVLQKSENADEGKHQTTIEYYRTLSTESYLELLKNSNDYNQLLSYYPLSCSALFDPKFCLDISKIADVAQQFPTEKRQGFYEAIFQEINSISTLMSSLLSILNNDSDISLNEHIQNILMGILPFSKVILFSYDKSIPALYVEKQKLKMEYILKDGIFAQALKSGKKIFISRHDIGLTESDLSILGKSDSMYATPLLSINSVLILYDRNGDITPRDDFLVSICCRFLKEIMHVIHIKKYKKQKIDIYQKMSDALIQLSSLFDMNNFLSTFSKSLESIFECQSAQLFRVSNARSQIMKIGHRKEFFNISNGIVGLCVSRREILSFESPENSIFFHSGIDRSSSGVLTRSIMVSPIFSGKGVVKWVIALYNKERGSMFTINDADSLSVFSKNFHSIAASIRKGSKITDEMKISNRAINDLTQVIDFFSFISDPSDINNLADQVGKKMSTLIGFSRVNVYLIDRKNSRIYGNGDEVDFFRELNPLIDDPIVRLAYHQKICAHNHQTVFFPSIDSRESINGVVVLTTEGETSNALSRSSFMLRSSSSLRSSKSNRITRKISVLGQGSLSNISFISSERTKKILFMWGGIIGAIIQSSYHSKHSSDLLSIARMLAEDWERLPSLFVASFLQEIFLFFDIGKGSEESIIFTKYSRDLVQKQSALLISLISSLKHPYSTANEYDVFEYPSLQEVNNILINPIASDEKSILSHLMKIADENGVLSFFGVPRSIFEDSIRAARSRHKENGFKCWRLSFDSAQFCFYIISQIKASLNLSNCHKSALFLHLIYHNSLIFDESTESTMKYYLENGPSYCISSIIYSFSPLIKCITIEKKNELFCELIKLDNLDTIESATCNNLTQLVYILSNFSFLAQGYSDSEKWIQARFDDELEYTPDMISSHIDYEFKNIIQPVFGELFKMDYKLDVIRKLFSDTVSKLTSH